ncbi:MAG: hypothetical protein ACP5M9_03335, partial [Candidatus Micrarchaeia archaeon]
MHATMTDTWPPILYLNDTSKEIIYALHELNESQKESRCIGGYTFDAGPNAHIITTENNKDIIIDKIKKINGVKNIIISGMGKGPRIVDKKESLIDTETLELIHR